MVLGGERLLCGQNVKYERGKCPIYSHVDKREKCVSVCHKMGNNIHVQTISSNKQNPPVQEIFYPSRWHHLLPPVFYWWQMLWGLQCSTYIPMKIYKSQSNQAEWNKSSFLNVFISQFKGSTVLEDNGLWTRQKSSTNSASASAVEQQE